MLNVISNCSFISKMTDQIVVVEIYIHVCQCHMWDHNDFRIPNTFLCDSALVFKYFLYVHIGTYCHECIFLLYDCDRDSSLFPLGHRVMLHTCVHFVTY